MSVGKQMEGPNIPNIQEKSERSLRNGTKKNPKKQVIKNEQAKQLIGLIGLNFIQNYIGKDTIM